MSQGAPMSASRSANNISDESESKEDNAAYFKLNPTDLEKMILDYLPVNDGDDAGENFSLLQDLPFSEDDSYSNNYSNKLSKVTMGSFYRKELTFFENMTVVKILEAAHEILLDNADEVERLVAKNPSIRFCVVEVTDHDGNRIKGNLLWIAAIIGNFNPRAPKESEKNYGIVERLSRYYPEEEVRALCDALSSPAWEAETARRMQPFVNAFDELMQKLVRAQTTQFATLKVECKSDIDAFKNKLKSNPNEVITFGCVFDLKVIADAINKANDNINALGGWRVYKIDVLSVVGIGSFYRKVPTGDARIIKRGVQPVVDEGALPDRAENFNNNNSYNSISSGGKSLELGSDFLWDINAAASWVSAWGRHWLGSSVWVGKVWKTYVEQKHQRITAYAATWQTIESELRDNVSLRSSS
jgi:hypothetical protein